MARKSTVVSKSLGTKLLASRSRRSALLVGDRAEENNVGGDEEGGTPPVLHRITQDDTGMENEEKPNKGAPNAADGGIDDDDDNEEGENGGTDSSAIVGTPKKSPFSLFLHETSLTSRKSLSVAEFDYNKFNQTFESFPKKIALLIRSDREGRPIELYNHGRHRRDFTWVEDVVDGVLRVLDRPAESDPEFDPRSPVPDRSDAPFRIYNLGNDTNVDLLRYVELIEVAMGRSTEKILLPKQPGDVEASAADVGPMRREFGWKPSTPVEVGVPAFIEWWEDWMSSHPG